MRLDVLRSTDIPELVLDATQLYQAILNLTINAVQAVGTEQGRVVLGLETVRLDHEPMSNRHGGHYVQVSVSDDGVGIDPECIQSIFDPFYTTKRDGTGTGLGLSIVKRVAQDHGGDVTVTSQLGEGATFRIQLPIAEA